MMSTCCSIHVEAWNKYIKKECVKLVINQNNLNTILFFNNFYRGHAIVFNELQDKQLVYGCPQTQQYI
jgi:hypothetical protein